MGYRVHTTSTDNVEVQYGTMAEIAHALNLELDPGEENEQAIVFNDTGNLEAFVLKGPAARLMTLAFDVAANALGTDTQLRKVIEEAIGDAYAHRLGEALGIADPELEDIDRDAMKRFVWLARQLDLDIS